MVLLPKLLGQAFSILLRLYRHGISHFDLKPANVTVIGTNDDELELRIIDFGFARIQEGCVGEWPGGTAAFQGPELSLSAMVCGHAADLWAAGKIFFKYMFGSKLFHQLWGQSKGSRARVTRMAITIFEKNMVPDDKYPIVDADLLNLLQAITLENPLKRLH